MESKLQAQRDFYIKQLGKSIAGQLSTPNPQPEMQIQELGNSYLRAAKQQHEDIEMTLLNSYYDKLANTRQITPATRGSMHKIVYGN